ncbi:ATP-binding protein [Actinoplanes sp. NPDC048988]|uniref:ATP-binding protein n=1 Tax=Actinoplanes sp. NPDC048988 TaxID=3363901 RepID=UPI00371515E6
MSVPGDSQSDGHALRVQILGPMRVWRGPDEIDVGPRQRAYLLALLVARVGRPVGSGELVDMIWGEDAPVTALNVIHKYVGGVRRVLQPTLAARASGSYLLRRGNGYVFMADAGTLDLLAFRQLVETARGVPSPGAALDRYLQALRLWHGPAGDGLPVGPEAISLFTGLNGEFFAACTAAAELAVPLGRGGELVPALELAAAMEPLHEPVQAALVLSLGAAGQQAKALSVFAATRARLAEELGVTPGAELMEAKLRVLRQAVTSPPPAPAPAAPAPTNLVGRAEEVRLCRDAVAAAAGGSTALVVVQGEPGLGKTRLLEETAAEAGRRGALVVWGRCLEGDGTPAMWPWTQVVRELLDAQPAARRREWLDRDLGRLVEFRDDGFRGSLDPDNRARFRLFEQAVALVAAVAADWPVVVILDDLQWADVTSLQLFDHLVARLSGGTLVIGALRDRAPVPGPELLHTLAAASRVPHHRRIQLGPLRPADVAELVRRETGRRPAGDEARRLHARTAGNPFFVRELSRLPGGPESPGDGTGPRPAVPSTIRDVVRDRMARVEPESVPALHTAALLGRDVDLRLLAGALAVDVQLCLDRVDPLLTMGLLETTPENPFTFRFAHDLVRESVIASIPQRQAARLHLGIADALEPLDPDGDSTAERLAHHLWSAGPLADPKRAAAALLRAAESAVRKTALESAVRHLTSAAQVSRSANLGEVELSALTRLTMARMRLGQPAADEVLDRAEHLARALGRDNEAADILFTRVIRVTQFTQPDRGRLARRLLDWSETSADPAVRACGQQAWGLHQWDLGNIDEAHLYLDRAHQTLTARDTALGENPLRHDLQIAWPMMQGVVTALHGDVGRARALLDQVEADAGDLPYAVTISSHYSGMVATMIDDPDWAARSVARWIAGDPQDYAHVDHYLRLTRHWARARAGDDPAGAAAAALKTVTSLLDPPQWGVSFHYALIGEMWLMAGRPAEATAALDQAEHYQNLFGQRYAEGLLLLLRARVLAASGEPAEAVKAAAERARALSAERGAHLFARRAGDLLAELGKTHA